MIKIASALGAAPKYQLEIADTIIEFNGRPLRVIKMLITGSVLPQRSAPVFVRIRSERNIEESWLAEIAADNMSLFAYFPIDTDLNGSVEFGYPDEIIAVFKNVKWESLQRLEKEKIERDVVTGDKEWIRKMRASKKS